MNRCSSCGFARLALAGAEGRGDGPLPGARKVPYLAHRVLRAWFFYPRLDFFGDSHVVRRTATRQGRAGGPGANKPSCLAVPCSRPTTHCTTAHRPKRGSAGYRTYIAPNPPRPDER